MSDSKRETFKTNWALTVFLVFFAFLLNNPVQGEESAANFSLPCPHPIYCQGPILKAVQLCKVLEERKTFVDQSLVHDPEEILASFANLNFTDFTCEDHIQQEQLKEFVTQNFENGSEFEPVTFPDWTPSPEFLLNIRDLDLRDWGSSLHEIWNDLGRQIKEEVQGSDRTSIIYSPNPMVVPGGRFREFYYWDSYWIQRGLLVSNMSLTVKGMIDNFLDNVKNLGYVPNGGRIYYERSQPPLLIPMVEAYYQHTGDLEYLRSNFWIMETEFQFWWNNRTINFEKDGVNYRMARYAVDRQDPRPEAFEHEYNLINPLDIPEENKSMIYSNLKSACESGWDFSTRWFKLDEDDTEPAGFIHTKTRDIIPVDLNSFLYWNAILLEKYCGFLQGANCSFYGDITSQLKLGIYSVFWDEELGSWYDYDWVAGSLRTEFYVSNIAPLWVRGEHLGAITRVLANLEENGALQYPAGIPTSLTPGSQQQWDFPNAWPPLVHMVVEAFENSGNPTASEIAARIAADWVSANYIGWKVFNESMYEKYDATRPGCPGGEGYYDVVLGFGWTNGVILDFFQKYGDILEVPEVPTSLNCSGFSVYDHVVTLDTTE